METEGSSLQSQQPTTLPHYNLDELQEPTIWPYPNRDESSPKPQNSPTLDPILTEMNPVHIFTTVQQ
jgi:hypothetical protein